MQAREDLDEKLMEIDQHFASKTGSRRSFTKECSPEIGIAVSPDDLYALWLAFLEAAESQRLPGLRRKADDFLRRHHYRYITSTPHACLRATFGALLSDSEDVRTRFLEDAAIVAGLKGAWSSHGLASWFNVFQSYRDALARHNTYIEYIRTGQALVRAAMGDDAVSLWDRARDERVSWAFVAVTDARAAYSDRDRARFIRGMTKSTRVPLSQKGARANDWRQEAPGNVTYGHVYEKVLCSGKKPEEDWFAPFVRPNSAADVKLAGEYGRETDSIVQGMEREMARFLAAGVAGAPAGASTTGTGKDAGVISGRVVPRRNADAVPALAGQGDGLSTLSQLERLSAMPYVVAARTWAQNRYWRPRALEDIATDLAEVVEAVTNCITAAEEVSRIPCGGSWAESHCPRHADSTVAEQPL